MSFLIFGIIYIVAIAFSLTKVAEKLYRKLNGVRELRTKEEKELLEPIFNEVYKEAKEVNKNLSNNIKLFIMDSTEVNAFAYGRETLCVNKGSIELLNSKCLYGLMAHEFGHFSSYDTIALLTSVIGNITLTTFTKAILLITRLMSKTMPSDDKAWALGIVNKVLIFIYKAIILLGDLILMPTSRKGEYRADKFACSCGYGEELYMTLKELDLLYKTSPEKFMEQLRSTHPPISRRLQKIEENM